MLPNLKKPSSFRFAIALLLLFAVSIGTFAAIDFIYFANQSTIADFEPDPTTTGGPEGPTGGSGTRMIPRDQPPVSTPHSRGH